MRKQCKNCEFIKFKKNRRYGFVKATNTSGIKKALKDMPDAMTDHLTSVYAQTSHLSQFDSVTHYNLTVSELTLLFSRCLKLLPS